MRLNFTLFILLLFSCTAQAQKLTGVWRGYFSSSVGVFRGTERDETYKYEIQIEQQTNSGVHGVTYSYKSTVFYAKADLQGIFTGSAKSLIIKETRMAELKASENSDPCLMTCYLDYIKIGKLEVLEGTFISTNIKTKADCGSGKVYLERVATSDFKMEDFLVNRKPDDSNKTSGKIIVTTPSKTAAPKTDAGKSKAIIPPSVNSPKKDNLVTKIAPVKPADKEKNATSANKPAAKPQPLPDKKVTASKSKPQSKKDDSSPVTTKPVERSGAQPISVESNKQDEASTSQQPLKIPVQIPRVLVERENALAKVITTSEELIQIDFYDNGEIDNDTISVYHNNQLVVSHGRLNTTPITVKIKCSKTDNHHELIVVAENLGDIPPNTAALVITAGRMRQEVNISSNERRNAKLVINYVPKEGQ